MKITINKIFTFILLLLGVPLLYGQTFIGDIQIGSDQIHVLTLKDGKEREGQIRSIENTELTFFSTKNNSTKTYHLSDIDQIAVKDAVEELPVVEMPEVNGLHRLIYSETGFLLNKGEKEYRTYWGIIHTFDYGVNDGFTVGTGVVYPGYLILHAKVNLLNGYRKSNFRLGVDFKTALRPFRIFDDFEEREVIRFRGFFQTSMYSSYGNEDRNIHISFNMIPIFEPNEFFNAAVFTFTFGGNIRIAPHWRLIYENSFGGLDGGFTGSSFGLFSGMGVHWFNAKHGITAAIQPTPLFGFVNFPLSDVNNMHRLPILSYSYKF